MLRSPKGLETRVSIERIGVAASGGGSNFKAILDAGIPVSVLLTDDPSCGAIDIAREYNIPVEVVTDPGKGMFSPEREAYTDRIIAALEPYKLDLLVLAGFMIVIPTIVKAYRQKAINIHPSLDLKYKGAHAIRDALQAGEKVIGSAIHEVTEEMDVGRIFLQEGIQVQEGDTEDSLQERVKRLEWKMCPQVIKEIMEGKIVL
jgi:phosphoribosylglycinamide formyltransferase 1